jgi:hypothetical protein
MGTIRGFDKDKLVLVLQVQSSTLVSTQAEVERHFPASDDRGQAARTSVLLSNELGATEARLRCVGSRLEDRSIANGDSQCLFCREQRKWDKLENAFVPQSSGCYISSEGLRVLSRVVSFTRSWAKRRAHWKQDWAL